MADSDMHPEFKFENTGKKMPYTVPDGFFRELETSLNSIAGKQSVVRHVQAASPWMWIIRTSLTAAALVAIIFSLTVLFPHHREPENISVEQAFSNLSATDQDYIIDNFRNDMIIDY